MQCVPGHGWRARVLVRRNGMVGMDEEAQRAIARISGDGVGQYLDVDMVKHVLDEVVLPYFTT